MGSGGTAAHGVIKGGGHGVHTADLGGGRRHYVVVWACSNRTRPHTTVGGAVVASANPWEGESGDRGERRVRV